MTGAARTARSRSAAALAALAVATVAIAGCSSVPSGQTSSGTPSSSIAGGSVTANPLTRSSPTGGAVTGTSVTARSVASGSRAPSATASRASGISGVTVAGTVATGLTTPWGVGFLPDGTALVTERDTAEVLAIRPDAPHRVRRIGTVRGVQPGSEGGLLGLAVSPAPGAAPRVFVYYTAAGDNRVAVIDLSSDASRITGQRDILTGIPRASVHNGGRLAIGPDGYLYIATGDATDGEGAQQLDYLGGKILRTTLDGSPAPGNPFPQAPLVYSYGHRNVQGLAFDARGRLWAGEFGANAYDELNLIRPGGNYGWPVVEGPAGKQPGKPSGTPAADTEFIDPYRYWPTSEASPSGLAIVGETAFLAALRGTRLWLIPLSGPAGTTGPVPLLQDDYGRLRTVVAAPDGSLWLTTSNTDGRGDPKPGDDRILRLRTS